MIPQHDDESKKTKGHDANATRPSAPVQLVSIGQVLTVAQLYPFAIMTACNPFIVALILDG